MYKSTFFIAAIISSYCHAENSAVIAPKHEHITDIQNTLNGPAKSNGIKSAQLLGTLPLAGELKTVDDKEFRVRKIEMLPDAKVAVHKHKQRPGVAYIIKGEVTEYRSDNTKPVIRKAGEIAFEKNQLTHWWHNHSDEIVEALVVDIVETVSTAK